MHVMLKLNSKIGLYLNKTQFDSPNYHGNFIFKGKYVSPEDYQLGAYRVTMKNNPLLSRSELGKTLGNCYKLPDDDFIYGKPYHATDGGVAAAMIHKEFFQSKVPKKAHPRDYIKTNVEAVKSGIIKTKEHSRYRKISDFRCPTPQPKITLDTKPLNLPPDMTFGIPTRPSTPMFDVLEHKFQEKWLKGMRDQEIAESERLKKEKEQRCNYRTRTAILRRYLPPIEEKSVWRMPKFLKTGPHLETFESPVERFAAFKAHLTDATSRRGLFGHGIYEPTKS